MKKKIMIIMMISLLITATFFLAAAEEQAAVTRQAKEMYTGRVISTMESGGYTYIKFEEKGQKLWVACPVTAVYEGEIIKFYRPMVMKGFYSKTLDRKFDTILFTGSVMVMDEGKAAADGLNLPKGHPEIPGIKKDAKNKITVIPGSIKKAKGGYTVAECYAMKKQLAGKEVRVRGIVVKFNPMILGRNWIHIKDGTGEKGTDDLTVTTDMNVLVGDTIVISGKMALDKDFGAGYVFSVIIENASVTADK
jgi:hypothetical protein